jgi:AmiR/NasT family two-component response regulator
MDSSREAAAETAVRQLQEALDSRVVIEQAKGMIAVQRGLPLADAFEQLRSEARRRRQSIHAVAAEVVWAHDGALPQGIR